MTPINPDKSANNGRTDGCQVYCLTDVF